MAKETHRVAVVWVCGVPFAVRTGKEVAQLLRLSARLAKLEERADGTIATLSNAATLAMENQMVFRVEIRDVECTDCETADTGDAEVTVEGGSLSDILTSVLGGRRATHRH